MRTIIYTLSAVNPIAVTTEGDIKVTRTLEASISLQAEDKHELHQFLVSHRSNYDSSITGDYTLSCLKLPIIEAFAEFFSLKFTVDPKWVNPYTAIRDVMRVYGDVTISVRRVKAETA